ncbi:basic salivary proline-rich protein 4-like [Motacilla alba alba]|uniref:basic salivary proline-rich protein 4-like n=1 Tax=Motacilla alba alba TaxID=1094192 RepID=UPI0018D599E3|nr:basic salivary proline-rich protein 4-like [Motacilla alba alba]
MPEEWNAIQRDLDNTEKRAHENLTQPRPLVKRPSPVLPIPAGRCDSTERSPAHSSPEEQPPNRETEAGAGWVHPRSPSEPGLPGGREKLGATRPPARPFRGGPAPMCLTARKERTPGAAAFPSPAQGSRQGRLPPLQGQREPGAIPAPGPAQRSHRPGHRGCCSRALPPPLPPGLMRGLRRTRGRAAGEKEAPPLLLPTSANINIYTQVHTRTLADLHTDTHRCPAAHAALEAGGSPGTGGTTRGHRCRGQGERPQAALSPPAGSHRAHRSPAYPAGPMAARPGFIGFNLGREPWPAGRREQWKGSGRWVTSGGEPMLEP